MLYQIHNGVVMYGADTILNGITFEIKNDREKIAVVGRNGCGKTTLLKVISGELDIVKRSSDEDMFISKTGNPVIGYLKQMTFDDDSITLEAEVKKVFAPIREMKAKLEDMVLEMEQSATDELVKRYTTLEEQFKYLGGYYYEKEYEMVLKKFGFTNEDKVKPLSEFSGGQRTKIAFIKLLLEKPDILLLDEPTNHLDIETVEWLEGYLKDYPRAIVVVSHDRMFLDHIVDTVYEIEYGRMTRYSGNYSKFVELKKAAWEKQKKDYELQQKEIRRLYTIVEKYKNTPSKVAMTRSKLKAIEHMDKIEAPDRYDTKSFKLSFKPLRETGKDVLFIDKLQIGYDSVLETLSLDMKRGEKIGIIGGNGIGKSTFLKTLVGAIEPLGGYFKYGVNVDVGYFDQQMARYSSKKQVIEDYWDEYPTLTETEVRNDLGAFLFTGEDVFKTVDLLSGGERVRLALAKIFKTGPNFLILDEPTNHMDMVGKETLESMLKDFEGSVIFVSHDRYFVKKVATKILDFEKDGVKAYPFGYAQYEESREMENASEDEKPAAVKVEKESAPVKPAASSYYNPGKERSKLEKKNQKIESDIARLEEEITALKDELMNPAYATAYGKLTEIQGQIDKKEEELLEAMEQWNENDRLLSELQGN
ncbi:MAG: ABC-F family ATP-binding cassette domain-containing protein [Lachnospiraceae bacterium]|nr:ABC-F family ATP-binding cassette domain-containing protein [Lachnospiraceae bacterium]